MLWKCKSCEALRSENAYLKKLVDSLLEKSSVRPVTYEEPRMTPEQIKAFNEEMEKKLSGELVQYGGDE